MSTPCLATRLLDKPEVICSRDLGALLESRVQESRYLAARWFTVSQIRNLLHDRSMAAICGQAARVHAIEDNDRLLAIASWTPLPWDTGLLGLSVARMDVLPCVAGEGGLEIQGNLIAAVVEDCLNSRIRYITTRVPAVEYLTIHAVESAGFQLIDGIQTFGCRLDRARLAPPGGVSARQLEPADIDEACAIARSAYRYDRFHSDPVIDPHRADALHESWVRNSCLGKAADGVVVAVDCGHVAGFVTCKIDHAAREHTGSAIGTIVLIATSSESRGKGIGLAVTIEALNWFREQGAGFVEVGTQITNVAAARLYEKAGFRYLGATLTYRRLLP